MMNLELSNEEQGMLAGDAGEATKLAMELVCSFAEADGADRLVPITLSHIGSAWLSGGAQLDFVKHLHSLGGRFSIPTWTAASKTCLSRPEFDNDPEVTRGSTELADLLTDMGCRPSFSCTPYYDGMKAGLGENIAVTESSAVVYLNTVHGARTNQGYSFIDTAMSICGRAPCSGLYVPENRIGNLIVDVSSIPLSIRRQEPFYHILGQYLGRACDGSLPVLVGLPENISERHIRAICASASTAGAIRMLHIPGVTPEAPDLETATRGNTCPRKTVTLPHLKTHRDELSLTGPVDGPLNAVCLGAPQMSLAEFDLVLDLLGDASVHSGLSCSASASRSTAEALKRTGKFETLQSKGVVLIPDTCTYASSVNVGQTGLVMTNSAKWAYYGPMCFDCQVAMGSLEECVTAAIEGKVMRNVDFWSDNLWQ